MELTEIKELIKAFDKSDCTSFRVEQGDFSIKLEKGLKQTYEPAITLSSKVELPAAQDIEDKVDAVQEDGELVKAPLVGVFYGAPSPDAEPYVQVGSKVQEGQVLCLIEAMKMMSEIKAPKAGTIEKIYVNNQDVVGYDDSLFLIV